MGVKQAELARVAREQSDDRRGRFSVLELLAVAWVAGICGYYYWTLGFVALAGHLLGVSE